MGKFFTRAQVVVRGTVVQESPQRIEEEILLSRHLVTSLGTVPKKSWDSSVWGRPWSSAVLGRSWDSTVLGQSLDGAVLGQSWARAVLVRSWDSTVLGRDGLETVQSWDSAVLGQWSWDSSLGTVVLGQ